MKKIVISFFSVTFYLFTITPSSYSQGCSDAGLCSIGSMQSANSVYELSLEDLMNLEVTNRNRNDHKIILSEIIGIAEDNVLISSTDLSLEFSLDKKTTLFGKIPYIYTNGNLGSLSGIGDISFGVKRTVSSNDKYTIDVTLGVQLPVNNSNLADKNVVLPMPYQTSLGTFDLIVGGSILFEKWHFAAGYQQVLVNRNENSFVNPSTPADEGIPYFQSLNLRRGNDLMFRVERVVNYKKLTFFFGAMPIIRLNRDEIEFQGERVELNGTTGPVFNFTAGVLASLGKKTSLRINTGGPIYNRRVRTDGLARLIVGIVAIEQRF